MQKANAVGIAVGMIVIAVFTLVIILQAAPATEEEKLMSPEELRIQNVNRSIFIEQFTNLVDEANILTNNYQLEDARWRSNTIDNDEMIMIIDSYSPQYQDLINKANTLVVPSNHESSKRYLALWIEYESQSNLHFRNYLVSGDEDEYEKSMELLEQSYEYFEMVDGVIETLNYNSD